jgi:hypothetical protein
LHSCRYFCVWHSSLRFHLITLISSVLHLIISAPWRNKQSWKIPRGNQNRQSEEGTTQHNIQQKKAKGQTTIYETLHRKKTDRATRTRTLLKIGCELKCSGRVCSCTSLSTIVVLPLPISHSKIYVDADVCMYSLFSFFDKI